jgi:hypothetical protein
VKSEVQIFKGTRELKGAKMVGVSIYSMQLWLSKHVLYCTLCISPESRSLCVDSDREVSYND